MKLSLDIKTSLSQTLTPQQIQYLKLLQLPLVQLEQHIMQEIEQNPMLDEAAADDDRDDFPAEAPEWEPEIAGAQDGGEDIDGGEDRTLDYERIKQEEFSDDFDPFEFYKQIIQDDSSDSQSRSAWDEDEGEGFQIKAGTTLIEDLTAQLRLLRLTPEEFMLGVQIIGNIDSDGYLRRELEDIVDETNSAIAEINFDAQRRRYEERMKQEAKAARSLNPARQFALSSASSEMLEKLRSQYGSSNATNGYGYKNGKNGAAFTPEILNPVTQEQAEKVLSMIQALDPPGVGSRDIRECLLAQLMTIANPTLQQKLAREIIDNYYEPFAKKHFSVITKQLSITDNDLRDAMDVIRRLNPKPGGGDSQAEHNTVIPDFIIERDEESGELMVGVNDSRLPALKLSKTYEKLKKDAKNKSFNKDTRNWLRNKHEDAKFLIQAIRQRKSTMLKVMTAIAGLQKEFFIGGKSALRPLIYKDIAETTGLDISTVCRIVNGKYVQTDYGTFELKYFFSESLPNDDGEEVSTTVIKQIIKEMIDDEPKNKPLSDDKISEDLKARGYNVARRTVAKYREQMKIPVARLRREI